jgi:hypothetical protein
MAIWRNDVLVLVARIHISLVAAEVIFVLKHLQPGAMSLMNIYAIETFHPVNPRLPRPGSTSRECPAIDYRDLPP